MTCGLDGVCVFSLEVTVINLSVHQDSYVNVHATRPPTTAIAVDVSPSPSQSTVYLLSLYISLFLTRIMTPYDRKYQRR